MALGLQGDQASPAKRKSTLNIDWEDLSWGWSSSTLATWCEELTHWKSPWCWERLKAGGEGDNRGWDGWMASPTQWTWVRVNSGSLWWTGRPGVPQFMGWQRIRHNLATEQQQRKMCPEMKWGQNANKFIHSLIYFLSFSFYKDQKGRVCF